MQISQSKSMNTVISWFFLAYFLILFAERTQSVIRACSDVAHSPFGSRFDGYVNILTIFSLFATAALLICANRSFWLSLFQQHICADYTMLTLTAGVLLLSGMVHTAYTVAPVQFASYGMLILAMVLRTVQCSAGASHPFRLWYSLLFLIVFSMAIPVMYPSKIQHAALFHCIEAVAALVLVFFFTWMLRDLFVGKGENLLRWIPMLLAAVLDSVILALRWKESVNTFVLIFLILSAVLFALGKVLFAVTG